MQSNIWLGFGSEFYRKACTVKVNCTWQYTAPVIEQIEWWTEWSLVGRRLDRFSNVDALSLLQTPHVRRRATFSASHLQEQQDVSSSAATMFTPQSILKVPVKLCPCIGSIVPYLIVTLKIQIGVYLRSATRKCWNWNIPVHMAICLLIIAV